jgi:hypothetical protein
MNKTPTPQVAGTGTHLLEKAAEIIRGYELDWKTLALEPAWQARQPDAYVEIGKGPQKLQLVVETKLRPRTGQAGAILAHLRQFDRPGLLIAEYIDPQFADELRRQNLFFIDLAGNAYLKGEGLLIWVTGRKDILRIRTERDTRRAFRPTGLRVIFALLCRPELVEKNYRTLAAAADVALGTVQWVMRDLREEGYIVARGRKERRLVELERLLNEWALGYARDLRQRLLFGRYEAKNFDAWRNLELTPYKAVWGGEAAAALLTGYLKPETLTLWVEQIAPRLVTALGLKEAERGPVEIREQFWKSSLLDADPHYDDLFQPDRDVRRLEVPREVAPPVLVYAELLALGEARALETAEQIRHEWIDGPFRRYRARTAN